MAGKAGVQEWLLVTSVAVLLSGCGAMGGAIPGVSRGTSPADVQGAAAGSSSAGANSELERCDEPLGTIAVDDGRLQVGYYTYGKTRSTQVNSLIRLAVQQSNCFVITSIGNLRTEDRLARITQLQRNSGEFRVGSKQQKGQRVAADFLLEPDVVIDNASTGGGRAGAGSLLGALAGSFAGTSSLVTLTVFDIRSGVQISISEGSSSASDLGVAIAAFQGQGVGGISGMSRTPEGKAVVAAFMDAYNNMVISMREYRAQEVKGGLGRGGQLKVAD